MSNGNRMVMGKLIGVAAAGAVAAATLASCGGGATAATPGGTSGRAASGGGESGSSPGAASPVASASAKPTAARPSTAAATPTGKAGGSAAITEESLRAQGVCASACTVTGRAPFTHPSWGQATLVTTIARGDGDPRAINAAVIGPGGVVLWQLPGTAEQKINNDWRLASPASDTSGLFFINYDPGRLNGVSVLQPVDGGMKVLAGWYNNEIGRTSTFYGGRLEGPGADGKYVIRVERNDCQPSCAKGSTKTTRYTWNGKAFAKL